MEIAEGTLQGTFGRASHVAFAPLHDEEYDVKYVSGHGSHFLELHHVPYVKVEAGSIAQAEPTIHPPSKILLPLAQTLHALCANQLSLHQMIDAAEVPTTKEADRAGWASGSRCACGKLDLKEPAYRPPAPIFLFTCIVNHKTASEFDPFRIMHFPLASKFCVLLFKPKATVPNLCQPRRFVFISIAGYSTPLFRSTEQAFFVCLARQELPCTSIIHFPKCMTIKCKCSKMTSQPKHHASRCFAQAHFPCPVTRQTRCYPWLGSSTAPPDRSCAAPSDIVVLPSIRYKWRMATPIQHARCTAHQYR